MAGRPPLAVGALGNVTAWKDGEVWRARARTRTAGGEVKRLFASGRSEGEVRAALETKADAHAFSAKEMSFDVTLSELLEMWLDDKSGEIKSQSVQQYRDTVRWLRPVAGSLSVADLTPARITQLLKVIGEDHSENKRRLARGALKAALQFPVEAGLLPHNPILSVRKERRRRQPLPTALNVEQVEALRHAIAAREERVRRYAGAVAAQHLRWVVEIQLGSGLRISEVLALRHRDVDLHEGVLSVTATMVEDDEYHLIRQDELKGRDQARVIELPRFAIAALEEARASCLDVPSRLPQAPALPGRGPSHINPRSIRRALRNARAHEALGLSLASTGMEPDEVIPHLLRRTAATLVAQATGSLEQASTMIGHSHIATTRTSYAGAAYRRVGSASILDRILGDSWGSANEKDPVAQ